MLWKLQQLCTVGHVIDGLCVHPLLLFAWTESIFFVCVLLQASSALATKLPRETTVCWIRSRRWGGSARTSASSAETPTASRCSAPGSGLRASASSRCPTILKVRLGELSGKGGLKRPIDSQQCQCMRVVHCNALRSRANVLKQAFCISMTFSASGKEIETWWTSPGRSGGISLSEIWVIVSEMEKRRKAAKGG